MEFINLNAVPAYWAKREGQPPVPFIVSLRLVDTDGNARLTPAVERSIDRTLLLTSRVGVAHGVIDSMRAVAERPQSYIQRVAHLEVPALVLFRCNTPELAERLMTLLSQQYEVTMIQEGGESARYDTG